MVEDGYITPEELMKTRNIPLVFANSYVVAFDKNGDGKLDRGGKSNF